MATRPRKIFLLVWTIQKRPIRWKIQFFIKALTPCSVPVISGEVAQVDQRCSLHVGPTAAPQTDSTPLPHYLPTKRVFFQCCGSGSRIICSGSRMICSGSGKNERADLKNVFLILGLWILDCSTIGLQCETENGR